MAEAIFLINDELLYFLTPAQRAGAVVYRFDPEVDGNVAVKHAVESLGIPHAEIDEIIVNGQPVGFGYGLHAGDEVLVRAWVPKPDYSRLRPPLSRPVRFVADTHLGRLAVYLRLLGFDTRYQNDYEDAMLAEISHAEGRVLLTRDRGLLKRSIVDFGYCVRQSNPQRQLIELIRGYALLDEIEPWRRCLRCNGRLLPVEKMEVLDRLQPKTKLYFDEFRRCEKCGQVYWRGSHFERMEKFIGQVMAAAQAE